MKMELTATELRIGNYLQRLDDSIFQVAPSDIEKIAQWEFNTGILPKPIRLIEEWLVNFGFKDGKKVIQNTYLSSPTKLYIYGEVAEISRSGIGVNNCPCKYVHQLQNLYFTL